MFNLLSIFDDFLPQLLLYPNPTDPLNPEAAAILLKDPDGYKSRVKEYVKKYAQKKQEASASTEIVVEKPPPEEKMEEEPVDEISNKSELSQLSETSDINKDI